VSVWAYVFPVVLQPSEPLGICSRGSCYQIELLDNGSGSGDWGIGVGEPTVQRAP